MRWRPVCDTLEDRQLPAVFISLQIHPPPPIAELIRQPALTADPQSRADISRLQSDVATLNANADGPLTHIALVLAHDQLAIQRAMRHAPTAGQVRADLASPAFDPLSPTSSAAQNLATLTSLGVPQRLASAYVNESQYAEEQAMSIASSNLPPLLADYTALLNDGVRTGAIQPGDALYDQVSGLIAQAKSTVQSMLAKPS
jgi:hypothetical protein